MRMQRSGLPLMVAAGAVLAAAAGIVLLLFGPFGTRPDGPADQVVAVQPEPPPSPEPPAPPPEPEPPAPPAQTPIAAATQAVRRGDTLYDIAGSRWGDPYLWPLLLAANADRLVDPDYLVPGWAIAIPGWVTLDSGLTDVQRGELSHAHVLAYRFYGNLGARAIGLGTNQPAWYLARLARVRMNKALWVLYSGLRYDEGLLERFRDRVDTADAAEVAGFVRRFGLPPHRR